MGFGFDETNVRRLDLAKTFENRARTHEIAKHPNLPFPKIVATSLGLENAERVAVQQSLTFRVTSFLGQMTELNFYYKQQINDGFENYTDCKSELALRRSQILS